MAEEQPVRQWVILYNDEQTREARWATFTGSARQARAWAAQLTLPRYGHYHPGAQPPAPRPFALFPVTELIVE